MRQLGCSETIQCLHLSVVSGLPCGSAAKESACTVVDLGSTPGLGKSPGEGKGYPLQFSGLKNSMDYTVHGVTNSWTRLSDLLSLSLHSTGRYTMSSPAHCSVWLGCFNSPFHHLWSSWMTVLGLSCGLPIPCFLLCVCRYMEYRRGWMERSYPWNVPLTSSHRWSSLEFARSAISWPPAPCPVSAGSLGAHLALDAKIWGRWTYSPSLTKAMLPETFCHYCLCCSVLCCG